MDVTKISKFNLLDLSDENKTREYLLGVDSDLTAFAKFAQSRVRFGDGSDGEEGENISGTFQVYTSNAVADTEDTIAHGLGVAPIGFLVINIDKGGVVYDGGTAWDSTNIYLKCSTAATTITLFLLK